jgi:alkylated DNA repair dioxygenase AlkB
MSLQQDGLFHREEVTVVNELGKAVYHNRYFSPKESGIYFEKLRANIEWHHDEVVIFGKHHVMRRKSAWYGARPFSYTYSKIERTALPWTRELSEIRERVREKDKTEYNSCLLNFYHDGDDGMGWHSDDEPELDPNEPICSVSFGAQRKFAFKRKSGGTRIDLTLEDGSALFMYPPVQKYWKHCLRKSKRVSQPRINLTFRVIKD